MIQPRGEHTGLQAEIAVIDAIECFSEVIERLDERDRPKGFIAVQGAIARHLFQQLRGQQVARARAARQHFRAGFAGVVDPVFKPLGGVLVDHRTDEGRFRARIAHR